MNRNTCEVKKMFSTVTILVLLSATAFTASATGIDFERIHRLIHLFHNATGIPGMAAAIVANEEPVFVRSYGLRDHSDSKSNVTADTLFEIGSCTKAFTAYLVASLVKEGRMAYEDPVMRHIPEFRMNDPHVMTSIQIGDLLDHASGLPGHDSVWYHANMSRDELLERISHLPLSYSLRENFQYSNILYSVAGIATERVTNRSWENEIQERIFRPLNMTRSLASFAEFEQQPKNADIAKPYTTVRENSTLFALPHLDASMVGPAGSIFSSVNDMAKWIQFQMSESVPKEMHVVKIPVMAEVPDKANEEGHEVSVGYAYGWQIYLYRGQYVIQHSGQTDGFCTAVALFPEEKYGVVLLSNLDTVCEELPYLVFRISDIASNRSMSRSDEEWVKRTVPFSLISDGVGSINGVNQPQQYTGRYRDAGYGVIEVTTNGTHLSALYNNLRYILKQRESADFFILLPLENARTDGGFPRECSFSRISSGEVVALKIDFEPTLSPIVFEKQFPEALDPQYLNLFTGTFNDSTSSMKISLNKEECVLIAFGVPHHGYVKLKPLQRNWFCVDRCTIKFEFRFTSGNFTEVLVHQGVEVVTTLKKKND